MSDRNRFTDRELQASFADKDALVEKKTPFMIAEYGERDTTYEGKARKESVFTIFVLTGPDTGYEQLLTLGVTAARQRVGKLIRQRAPRGPVTLEKQTKGKDGKKRPNPVFVFKIVDDKKVIAAADALVAKMGAEGLEGSSDESGDGDLPF